MKTNFSNQLIDLPKKATGRAYWGWFTVFTILVLFGIGAWIYQLVYGLGVTGLNRPIFWGIYITNFVFFIGISHAGTLISAILRVSNAEWRRPVTRMAEAITVFALFIGASMILCDMGRPDRLLNVFSLGRIQSPLLWDVISISSYLFASIVYLYLPLIPDIAAMRDRMTTRGLLYSFYNNLALNWRGTVAQKTRLERAIGASAIMIIPLAVSVHTVVSYVFAMSVQPLWHSTIFGPYFVIGAIYSGIAVLLIAMLIARKALHLESFLKEVHFKYLCYLQILMFGLWFYATFGEYLVTGYGNEPSEMRVILAKIFEVHSWGFIGMFAVMLMAFFILTPTDRLVRALRLPTMKINSVAAFVLALGGWAVLFSIIYSKGMNSAPALVASVVYGLLLFLVVIPTLRKNWFSIALYSSIFVAMGMWLERFTIIVPTLARPRIEEMIWGSYTPSWVELSITVAALSVMALLFLIFAKVFPLISVWEVEEGAEAIEQVKTNMQEYLPDENGIG
ncbi:MAG: NrfD/PsrC family molybdoenzyme membrane anchor subunit [Planctomycetota bacterium]